MQTVGNGLLSLSPEAAIVVVLSQALVLFIFSSSELSNLLIRIGLPPIPLVPVSSTQVVVGAVLGIGLAKGSNEINIKAFSQIAIGWIATPLLAGVLSFFALFFVQNVFNQQITSNEIATVIASDLISDGALESLQLDFVIPFVILTVVIVLTALIFFIMRQQRLRLKAENELLAQQNQYFHAQRTISELEMKAIQSRNELLNSNLDKKRKEFINMAFNLHEQRLF